MHRVPFCFLCQSSAVGSAWPFSATVHVTGPTAQISRCKTLKLSTSNYNSRLEMAQHCSLYLRLEAAECYRNFGNAAKPRPLFQLLFFGFLLFCCQIRVPTIHHGINVKKTKFIYNCYRLTHRKNSKNWNCEFLRAHCHNAHVLSVLNTCLLYTSPSPRD